MLGMQIELQRVQSSISDSSVWKTVSNNMITVCLKYLEKIGWVFSRAYVQVKLQRYILQWVENTITTTSTSAATNHACGYTRVPAYRFLIMNPCLKKHVMMISTQHMYLNVSFPQNVHH